MPKKTIQPDLSDVPVTDLIAQEAEAVFGYEIEVTSRVHVLEWDAENDRPSVVALVPQVKFIRRALKSRWPEGKEPARVHEHFAGPTVETPTIRVRDSFSPELTRDQLDVILGKKPRRPGGARK